MMPIASLFAALFSVLIPTKMWFGTNQPVEFSVDAKQDITLVLTDFTGKQLPAKGSADVAAGAKADVRAIFPEISDAGTYVLYAVAKGKSLPDFLGTPVVLENRASKEDGKPTVIAAVPLQYVTMETEQGDIKMMFYYDVAPLTVDSFLRLSAEGFYDGLTFHRILKGFVIQGGDPRGDGTGSPGYSLVQEFNDRPHLPGVLSMAREANKPDSGGSQFFICLNYTNTKSLDHQYTAFGKVTDGMNVVNVIGAVPADPQSGVPTTLHVIKKVTVKPVTAGDNPYKDFFTGK
jgi:peptidyl-prolyl cis-trans isomerase B (cyclophilin B)